MRKIAPVLAVILAVCFVVVRPAYAADDMLSGGPAVFTPCFNSTNTSLPAGKVSVKYPYGGNTVGPLASGTYSSHRVYGLYDFAIEPGTMGQVFLTSNFGFYFSYFGVTSSSPGFTDLPAGLYPVATYDLVVYYGDGSQDASASVGTVTTEDFVPAKVSGYSYTTPVGRSFKVVVNASAEKPITGFACRTMNEFLCYAGDSLGLGTIQAPRLVIASPRLIYASAPGELEGLENIADSITAGNQILSAMYGDIMAICQAIYERCGDMLEAQNLANQYFAQLLPLIESVLASQNSTNNKIDQLYNYLHSAFAQLETAIELGFTSVVDAINDQTTALILYFDSVFQAGVNQGAQEGANNVQSGMDNVQGVNDNYHAQAFAQFDKLVGNFNGFSEAPLAGITLASSLFVQLWTLWGDYEVYWAFPLTLAICLVLVGRISRTGGKRYSGSGRGQGRGGGKGSGKGSANSA